MAKEILHTCGYCNKGFSAEGWFLKHHCKEMIREEEFASPTGQAAWNHYKHWIQKKHKGVTHNSTSFKKSKYFNNFYKFTVFSQRAGVPDVKLYINLMVAYKIDPINWTKDGAYRKFLDYITYKMSPHDQIKITVETLLNIAGKSGVDVSEIFETITPPEVIQLLYQRRLSPWVLLHSKKFSNFYNNKTTSEQQINMQALINPDHWVKKFKKSPQDVKIVKEYITELGL